MAKGRYKIIRKIADGGMAEIFSGTQHGVEGFERPVVLKRILPALLAEPQFKNLMIDEAHVAMSLSHSNIAQVLDLGHAKGSYYLVLELVDGWDLNHILNRLKALAGFEMPPTLSLFIVAEVCRALAYAHARRRDGKPLGIVHRDVSPHNVLISAEGEVKLTDFGIAKALVKRENTIQGVIKGKLAFMSPEQASGAAIDARSDLFSLGTLLYLMFTGKRPFEAPTDLESIFRVQQADFPAPEVANPGLAPEVAAIIKRAMQLRPSERYQGAEEMLESIENVQRQVFGPSGKTELKRWLAELESRDHVPSIGRLPAPPPGSPDETMELGDQDIQLESSTMARLSSSSGTPATSVSVAPGLRSIEPDSHAPVPPAGKESAAASGDAEMDSPPSFATAGAAPALPNPLPPPVSAPTVMQPVARVAKPQQQAPGHGAQSQSVASTDMESAGSPVPPFTLPPGSRGSHTTGSRRRFGAWAVGSVVLVAGAALALTRRETVQMDPSTGAPMPTVKPETFAPRPSEPVAEAPQPPNSKPSIKTPDKPARELEAQRPPTTGPSPPAAAPSIPAPQAAVEPGAEPASQDEKPDEDEEALMALAESDVDRLVIGDDPADVQPAPNVPKKHAAPSRPTPAHKQASPPKPSPAPVVASVKIVSRPSGAVVKMNKRVFGRAPMNLRFRAGQSYELHFVKQGYVPTTKRVLVSQRKNQTLTVALRKKPPAKKKKSFIQRVFGL